VAAKGERSTEIATPGGDVGAGELNRVRATSGSTAQLSAKLPGQQDSGSKPSSAGRWKTAAQIPAMGFLCSPLIPARSRGHHVAGQTKAGQLTTKQARPEQQQTDRGGSK